MFGPEALTAKFVGVEGGEALVVPVPVSAMAALTVPLIVSVVFTVPATVGVNLTMTVQDPLVAIVPPFVQVPPVCVIVVDPVNVK